MDIPHAFLHKTVRMKFPFSRQLLSFSFSFQK
nr:MAG TPA: hypothetical protein [Caudoviricetes sp.]